MEYEVEFLPAAMKQLEDLSRQQQLRIVRAARKLAEDPRPSGVVKLAGADNLWRIRVGAYRVVYEIHDGRLVVVVVRIGHCRDIYKKGM